MSDDVMTSHIPPILSSWKRGTCHMKGRQSKCNNNKHRQQWRRLTLLIVHRGVNSAVIVHSWKNQFWKLEKIWSNMQIRKIFFWYYTVFACFCSGLFFHFSFLGVVLRTTSSLCAKEILNRWWWKAIKCHGIFFLVSPVLSCFQISFLVFFFLKESSQKYCLFVLKLLQ